MNNSIEIFKLAININAPWYISNIELLANDSSVAKELHIYLDFAKGEKFINSLGKLEGAYDTLEK